MNAAAIGKRQWAMGDRPRRRRGARGYRRGVSDLPNCLLPLAYSLERREQGFTLVELMIVVTIAGILVTLAEPSFRHSVVNAREAVLKQDLFTMRDAIDQFRADRGKYPIALLELKEVGYLKRIPVDPFTRSDGTWQEIPDQAEGGVFDVHSGSDLVAKDGTPYNYW